MPIQVHIHIEKLKQFFKQIWIWMVRKDAFIYILFVGLSTLVWWGRAMSSQRELTLKLPIEYTDVPTQVVFEQPLPHYLEITLRDNGRLLRQIQHTKPHILMPLEEKLRDSHGTLQLSADFIRPKIQDVLPGSTSIQHIHPEEISSIFHIEATKRVPIKLRAQWTMETQHQLITQPELTPSIVEIYGTQEAIDAIDTITTDSIYVEKIVDTVHRELALVIPVGIRTATTATKVTWKSEQFTDKSFNIPIQIENQPKDEVIHIFPPITTVTARVGISHFADVTADDIRAVCTYPEHIQSTLPVEIRHNNPYITKIRSSVREVEYIIER
jgi:hypothetical protein